MTCLKNNHGIALVTALMLTLLSLVIVMALLYMVTQDIKTGGSRKVYRNAVEASYGGADVTINEIIPMLNRVSFKNTSTATAGVPNLLASLGGVNLAFAVSAGCLEQKLSKNTADWSSCPADVSKSIKPKDIKLAPDMTFKLLGASGPTFTVYSKIVDTISGTAYPEPPGGISTPPLLGGGVTDSGSSSTSSARHFIYRVEIISEKIGSAEQGNVSVLYEY